MKPYWSMEFEHSKETVEIEKALACMKGCIVKDVGFVPEQEGGLTFDYEKDGKLMLWRDMSKTRDKYFLLRDQNDVLTMRKLFLRARIGVIPCDDILQSIKGFLAGSPTPDEKRFLFGWKSAEPIEKIECVVPEIPAPKPLSWVEKVLGPGYDAKNKTYHVDGKRFAVIVAYAAVADKMMRDVLNGGKYIRQDVVACGKLGKPKSRAVRFVDYDGKNMRLFPPEAMKALSSKTRNLFKQRYCRLDKALAKAKARFGKGSVNEGHRCQSGEAVGLCQRNHERERRVVP